MSSPWATVLWDAWAVTNGFLMMTETVPYWASDSWDLSFGVATA